MSIERRLRTGLSANTEHLQPNLDNELTVLLRRARRRRRVRTTGLALIAAAAAAAGVFWLPGVVDSIRANDDSTPVDRPNKTAALPPRLIDAPYPLPVPGTYSVAFSWSAAKAPRVVGDVLAIIEVPAGFDHHREAVEDRRGAYPDEYRSIEFGIVDTVETKPCLLQFEDPGPTVADLAFALADQPRLSGTDPVPTSLDGYDGLYMEVSLREDVPSCSRGSSLWLGPKAEAGLALGVVGRLWILDVEGDRRVIMAAHGPDVTEDEIAELTRIVETTTFTTIERPER